MISRTPIRKPIIVIAWLEVGRDREYSFPVPAGFGRRGDTPTAPTVARLPYFGRYFLFNAQATENCGSTTLAM